MDFAEGFGKGLTFFVFIRAREHESDQLNGSIQEWQKSNFHTIFTLQSSKSQFVTELRFRVDF